MCTELPRISASFFIYDFVIQVVSENTMYSKGLTSSVRGNFYIKIIVTVIPANLDANLLLSLFCCF